MIRSLERSDVLCHRNGYHDTSWWSLHDLLDCAEACQALEAEDRLQTVLGIGAMIGDEKKATAGVMELFRLSLGPLAEGMTNG